MKRECIILNKSEERKAKSEERRKSKSALAERGRGTVACNGGGGVFHKSYFQLHPTKYRVLSGSCARMAS